MTVWVVRLLGLAWLAVGWPGHENGLTVDGGRTAHMRVRPFFVRLRDFLLRKPFYRDGWRSYACKTKPATVKTVAPINTAIASFG